MVSTKDLDRHLRRLDTPTHLHYLEAPQRALAYVIRSFGAELEPHEEHDLGLDYGEDDSKPPSWTRLLDSE